MSPLKRIIYKSKSLLSRTSESYGYIAFGMAIILLATKVSALLKLQLMTSVFGIGNDLDIFIAANTIPEFIFTVVAIGGINASLIPILTQTSINEDENRMKEVFSSIINIFFLVLSCLCLLVFIFAPHIIQPAVKLKIASVDAQWTTTDMSSFVYLLRILLASPIILCFSSIFSSILQIKKKFFITALAPLCYNLGVISATVLAHFLHRDIAILAYGVLFGSILHFAVQLHAIFTSKIAYSPGYINLKDVYVIKAMRQTLPRIIGLTSDYIGNIFQILLASRLTKGSIASFDIAISIREIPISIFGIAIATSVFPSLSALAEKKQKEEFQKLFSKALRSILFWTLPMSALLIVLRTPVVRLMFGIINRNMSLEQTRLISYTLLFLSLGIVFYSVLNLVNRAFYSLNDSKTPTVISIFVIFLELGLTYTLANVFSHFDNSLSVNPLRILQNIDYYFTRGDSPAALGGIGLASSIAISINLVLLIFFLHKKGIQTWYEPRFIVKKVFSTGCMFITGILSFKLFDTFFDTTRVLGLLFFTCNITVIMVGTFYLIEKLVHDEDIVILDDPVQRFKTALVKFKQITRNEEVTTGVSA